MKYFPPDHSQHPTGHLCFQVIHPPQAPPVDIIFTRRNFSSWDEALEKTNTVAFLIIQGDWLHFESYAHDYDESSIVASFSMAKSFLSVLIGIAIDEGLIASEQDPVTKYVPELRENGFDKVTIKHLLQMTSGMKFSESYYSPFADAADFYYGTRLRKHLIQLKLKRNPGEKFEYVSGSSQLLGLILERALKNKTVTQYLQEKIWTPLGMEYNASWSIDRKDNGIEKTFCCLNARARDFAKFGLLMMHKGNWENVQLIPDWYVDKIYGKDLSEGGSEEYQYHFWKGRANNTILARGHLGQYIYIDPDRNLVVVRLGQDTGGVDWYEIFHNLTLYYNAQLEFIKTKIMSMQS